ncbi:MAG: hypothetical protein LC104_08500 [Bacteroidales bacterium]|nr:hypothetical protein [Bacteroidales bacterium]
MGNGILVFLLIVVISAIIGAVSQMMKNVQAAAPPPRPGAQPRQSGDEIDKFLEEIDRLRKRKHATDTSGAQPVRRPTRTPVATPVAEPTPPRRERATDAPAFVPSRVTRLKERPATPPESRPTPPARPRTATPPKSDAPRVEDLPIAAPVSPSAARTPPKPAQPADTDESTEFTRTLSGLLGGKDGLSLAIAMQEILNPPRCMRNPWKRH